MRTPAQEIASSHNQALHLVEAADIEQLARSTGAAAFLISAVRAGRALVLPNMWQEHRALRKAMTALKILMIAPGARDKSL